MPHYLVTGAAGFIAARVCELVLDDGHTVVGVDNMNDAYDVRLKEWRLAQLEPRSGFTFSKLDICDKDALSELFRANHEDGGSGFSAVINLAARAGVRQSVDDPWIYLETNAIGALNLLELCREFNIQKYVLASTSSLYGKSNPRPYKEDGDTDGPLSPYAASKKAAEALCHTYHYLHGLDITVLRYFTVYGPAGRPDMSPFRFVQWVCEGRPLRLYGDGTQERDFTYVDDITRGTIAALKPAGFEVINLGSGKPIVLDEFIRLIERLAGKSAEIECQPRHPADVDATWADINKAREILSWQPEVDFKEGVERLVTWYQQNRDWAKNIDTR